jgi:hypothetical protein
VTADFAIFAIGCRGMACGFGRPPPRSLLAQVTCHTPRTYGPQEDTDRD